VILLRIRTNMHRHTQSNDGSDNCRSPQGLIFVALGIRKTTARLDYCSPTPSSYMRNLGICIFEVINQHTRRRSAWAPQTVRINKCDRLITLGLASYSMRVQIAKMKR